MNELRPNGEYPTSRVAAARRQADWFGSVRFLLPQELRGSWPSVGEDLVDVAMERSGRMWRFALAVEVLKLVVKFAIQRALVGFRSSEVVEPTTKLSSIQVRHHAEARFWYETDRTTGADMFIYTLRRTILSIPVLFAVLLITFSLGFYGPVDPLTIFLGEDFIPDEEVLQRLRKLHGLDRPFWVQFGDYIVGVAKGDFGTSLHGTRRPIIDIMRTTMPISFQLGVAASILLIVAGIPMGALAAVRQNTWIDYLIISFSISVRSVPVFVMAPMMLTGITHIKLPGPKYRTILDESHCSFTHECRQPSNQAHKTISRRRELAFARQRRQLSPTLHSLPTPPGTHLPLGYPHHLR